MKKLMIAMMAMGFAISTQAAIVSWTTGSLQNHLGATVGGSQSGYTMNVYFFQWVAGDWVAFEPGGVTSSSTTNPLGALAGNAGTSTTGFENSVEYKVRYTITGPASPEWFVDETITFTTKDNGATTVSMPAKWQQIPEPATMALLGIGIVAVGLRRRRK